MTTLKVYYDLMSQVSRAVVTFLKVTDIPYQPNPVALRNNEHYTEEYTKLNPFQRVPVLDDDGFILTESVAILRYLCDKYDVGDHWYPKDLQRRARVDEYMAWQHMNTRLNGSMVFRVQLIEPRFTNLPIDQKRLKNFQKELENTLDLIESVWLKDKLYLTGNEISIADIFGYCELMQPYAAGQDVREGRPVLAAWMERVKQKIGPHYDEIHFALFFVRDRFLSSQSNK